MEFGPVRPTHLPSTRLPRANSRGGAGGATATRHDDDESPRGPPTRAARSPRPFYGTTGTSPRCARRGGLESSATLLPSVRGCAGRGRRRVLLPVQRVGRKKVRSGWRKRCDVTITTPAVYRVLRPTRCPCGAAYLGRPHNLARHHGDCTTLCLTNTRAVGSWVPRRRGVPAPRTLLPRRISLRRSPPRALTSRGSTLGAP